MRNEVVSIGSLVAGQHFWYTFAYEQKRREFIKTTDVDGAGLPALPPGITLAVDLANGSTATFADSDSALV